MVAIQPSRRKTDLSEMRYNDMITRKVHAYGNKLCAGKEWGYMHSSLGGRLISVGRQAVR